MGAQYEIQWLAGEPYYVEISEDTGWQPKAVKMTPEQLEQVEKLNDEYQEKLKNLCVTF